MAFSLMDSPTKHNSFRPLPLLHSAHTRAHAYVFTINFSLCGKRLDRIRHHPRHPLDVPLVQPRHADPPGVQHEHVPLLLAVPHLPLRQSRVREHPDLISDVVPRALRDHLLQPAAERLPHGPYPGRHLPELRFPVGSQPRFGHDPQRDLRPERGGIRVHRPRLDLQLTDARLRAGPVGTHQVQGPDPLPVQTHVLGEGARHEGVQAKIGEEADGAGVPVEISGGEALIGVVEEGLKFVGLHDLRDFLPLLRGGVDAGGVVRAHVQHHRGPLRSSPQVLQHTLEVQPRRFGFGGVDVAVFQDPESAEFRQRPVIRPRRIRQQNRTVAAAVPPESRYEFEPQPTRAGTAHRLQTGQSSLLPHAPRPLLAEHQILRRLQKFGVPSDRLVFVRPLLGG
mmetsp:Transcript_21153/g.42679  ORF Transcript_21153/g.42679 Transcript_21153/m.42679 type:complete len:395 (+) Transcript_21153:312-1496(+)